MNPEELERLRRLFMSGLQAAPRDATATPRPLQPMTMRAADDEVGLPDVPKPSAAQRAVQVAQEFVPGFGEGMAVRRMANEARFIEEALPKGMSSLRLMTSGAYRAAEAPAQRRARDVLAEQGLEYTQYTPYGGKAKRGQHLIVYDPNNVRIRNILQALGLMTGAGAIASEEEPENP